MRSSDVEAAAKYGADAFGFVVASPSSRRNLSMAKARSLAKAVPVFGTKIAVTASRDTRILRRVCEKFHPDGLQLHQADKSAIRRLRKEHPEVQLILATPVRDSGSIAEALVASRFSDAVLADSLGADGMGGTGRTHDWSLSAKIRDEIFPHPLILAGGLTPANVRLAIAKVQPHAVDVSSGVEVRVGMKDPVKIRGFIRIAKWSKA
jgi:phosphoribosylanthranilate isomerase